MAETCFTNLIDMVVGKSEILSFSQVCEELGLQNNVESLVGAMSNVEPLLLMAEEEQAYTPQLRLWCLNLKTSLYETEDMLDNQHNLRNHVIRTIQSQMDGSENIGNMPDDHAASIRVDLENGTLGSFLIKVICGFLFVLMVLLMLRI